MLNPFFTVVIPTYNRSKLLKRAMQSVLNQTFKNFEIIVVDDHSTDDTKKIVKSYSDKRIHYRVNSRTKGACGSRNVGIFVAKGEWIAFLDDDDVWFPEKLANQNDVIQKSNSFVGMVCTDYSIYKGERKKLVVVKNRPVGNISRKILYGNIIGCLSSTCVRTDILLSIRGFDERLPSNQDWDLWYRVSKLCEVDNVPITSVKMFQDYRIDRIGHNYKSKLDGQILLREKYFHIINGNLRLRHRHESLIFTYAFLESNFDILFKSAPWFFVGALIDFYNFANTIRTMIILMLKKINHYKILTICMDQENKKMEIPLNCTIGILDTADYTNDELYGGSTGYIKTILPFLKKKRVIIVGQGLNGTIPWKNIILGDNLMFIPVAEFKHPSKIPLRIKAFFYYTINRNKILNLGIDILYIHSPEICLPFLFLNKKIPVIYHQHGFSNALHSSKFPYGELSIFRKFFDLSLKIIHKKANWIVAIDPEGLIQSKNNGAIKKTSLMLNAINTSLFKPNNEIRSAKRKNFNFSDDLFVIINTGRIEKQKGIERLLQCIPIFKSEKFKFHILIIGDGTYKNRLVKMVKTYNAENDVSFVGIISHEKLPEYYNMADVFVLPSEKEGVPMAILESLACGTPVVANAIGGIPKIVKSGKNGELLTDLSIKTIASSIMNIKYKNYKHQDISKSVDHLSSQNAVKHLEEIIKRII